MSGTDPDRDPSAPDGHRPWDDKRVEALGAALVTAVNTARIGLAVVRKEIPEPRIVYMTAVGAEILGRPRARIVDQPARSFLTPEEREVHSGRETNAPGVTRTFDTMAQTEDGRRVPVEVTLAPMDLDGESIVVVFFRDISARRRAVAELAESQERFRLLLELAPDAVWISDGRQLIYVNQASVRMLGYDSEAELLKVSPLRIVHPDEHAAMIERSREMIVSGRALEPREYRTCRRDGSVFVAEVQSMPIDWGGKKVILGIARDVTVRKEMELRLARSERLAALGTLLGGIAHEMNNPLTTLLLGVEQAFAQLADLGDADEADVARLRGILEDVRQGATRVASVVGQLRATARVEAADRGPVDLRAVVEAALVVAKSEIGARARLIVDLAHVPPIEASAPRLEQVIVNLLVNAADSFRAQASAVLGAGGVVVGVGVVASADHEIRVALAADRAAGAVILDISDNGSGIPADVLPRIFDPFFTTKGIGSGMGLGLSICHGVVTSYGGTIDVDSAPGRGSRFRIRFPVHACDAARPSSEASTGGVPAASLGPAPPSAPHATGDGTRRRRILVVDDEPALGAMIHRMLEEDFDVDVVSDARKGLAMIPAGETPYDVILCDLMMPDMTGMDFHQAVIEKTPRLGRRFVFMTGGAFTGRAADFLAAGQRPCLEKPFDYTTLRAVIERR